MQMLIIFGPRQRVINFTFSIKKIFLVILFLLLLLSAARWPRSSVFISVKDALYSEMAKKQGTQIGFPDSESAKEMKLLQLQGRLDLIQDALDRMMLSNGSPLIAPFKPIISPIQRESYGVRLDHVYGHSFVLEEKLRQVQQIQDSRTGLAKIVPSIAPLLSPLQISSGLGFRIDPFTRQLAWHAGVDYQAAYGTPILATSAGVVVRANWDSEYGYVVDILHANSVTTRYAHAQRLLVKQGDSVGKSQVIAMVGSTGRSTGPHLHYEVLKNGKELAKGG